eukprot:TRINITY_DN781815_c0_g1_i1.p1 TRINITY_DN781815_c0_g1~~TRINITY_DN781815_c0_g1_i1.p1  ORF type:complete len:331 (+),score=72.15 TRINITY_DN781815_c0_g1_i1:51-1043(+)
MVHINPLNDWIFQSANFFLLLSYINVNILWLRATLTLGSMAYAIWGWVTLAVAIDTVLWNVLFAVINIVHIILLLYRMRPIKLEPDFELVYEKIFKATMSRIDFFELTKGKAFVRTMSTGDYYATVGSQPHNLSILISGEVYVEDLDKNKKKRKLHPISAFEFLDSPEWINRAAQSGKRFNVSIKAMSDVKYLMFPRETLTRHLAKNPHLESIILGVTSVDVSKKLVRMNKVMDDFALGKSPMLHFHPLLFRNTSSNRLALADSENPNVQQRTNEKSRLNVSTVLPALNLNEGEGDGDESASLLSDEQEQVVSVTSSGRNSPVGADLERL